MEVMGVMEVVEVVEVMVAIVQWWDRLVILLSQVVMEGVGLALGQATLQDHPCGKEFVIVVLHLGNSQIVVVTIYKLLVETVFLLTIVIAPNNGKTKWLIGVIFSLIMIREYLIEELRNSNNL